MVQSMVDKGVILSYAAMNVACCCKMLDLGVGCTQGYVYYLPLMHIAKDTNILCTYEQLEFKTRARCQAQCSHRSS